MAGEKTSSPRTRSTHETGMCRQRRLATPLPTSNGWKPTDLGFTGAQRPEGLRRQKERRNQMTKSNANGSNATIIHMSLQGKGGVGKSLVAANLSQYLGRWLR